MNWQERAEKAESELARLRKQKPVAFWWIGEGGENHGGPYRGMASEFSIDNARNSGCSPQYLYAGPVPAVAAGLPAIGPYRDFIPAPAVPDWDVNIERIRDVMHMLGISIEESVECFSAALPTNINRMTLAMKRHLQKLAGMTAAPAPSVTEEWREVMTELADDLAIEIDQSYPPERRAYPSEQRRYEREMEIVNRARALLQSSAVKDSLTTAPAAQEVPMEVSLGKGEFVIWPINDWNGRQGLAFVRDANPRAVGTCHPEPASGSIEIGADDLVISFANVASAMVLADRLQYVIGQMIAVPAPAKEKEYAWECNECGAQEYTMSGGLACGSCGCDEFHKAEVRHD